MSILITGALGYIGSHISVELLNENYDIVLLDNLNNSKEKVKNRIFEITNKSAPFYNVNMLNLNDLERVFSKNNIQGVIHLAGSKSVNESISDPLKYYSNNVLGLINLLFAMQKFNVKNIIFSSSATVYGNLNKSPLKEDMPLNAINPYGSTKIVCEQILKELYNSDNNWSIGILRYFNPVGAHESGLIGEDPNGIPNNLMPYILRVASGRLEKLYIYGNDYMTEDGTGIRDFIHVVDLAKGHIKVMKTILKSKGVNIYNLGSGKGYSVLEVVKTFERVTNQRINYEIVGRRQGDLDICYADTSKALRELDWRAEKDLESMCLDSWRWEKNNMGLGG